MPIRCASLHKPPRPLSAAPALETALWWPPEHYRNGIGGLGYLQPEVMPEIQEELHRLGFSSSEQEGILGLNMLRVAEESW